MVQLKILYILKIITIRYLLNLVEPDKFSLSQHCILEQLEQLALTVALNILRSSVKWISASKLVLDKETGKGKEMINWVPRFWLAAEMMCRHKTEATDPATLRPIAALSRTFSPCSVTVTTLYIKK